VTKEYCFFLILFNQSSLLNIAITKKKKKRERERERNHTIMQYMFCRLLSCYIILEYVSPFGRYKPLLFYLTDENNYFSTDLLGHNARMPELGKEM